MTNQNYEFVHNMVTGKYQVMSRMVKDAKYRKYTYVSDDILHSIWMKMDLKGIHTSVQKLWVNPHYVNQSMLILVGKGGIYKTTILGHRDLPGVKKECPCFDTKAWLKEIDFHL